MPTLCPAAVGLLIHFRCYPRALDQPNAGTTKKWISYFLSYDLIIADNDSVTGYEITKRGVALMNMICNTPLPEREYVDPRDGCIIPK